MILFHSILFSLNLLGLFVNHKTKQYHWAHLSAFVLGAEAIILLHLIFK